MNNELLPDENGMVSRDATWIYKALGDAFTAETGLEWQSISRVIMKPIVDVGVYAFHRADCLLELSHIEFEIEGTAREAKDSTSTPQADEDPNLIDLFHENERLQQQLDQANKKVEAFEKMLGATDRILVGVDDDRDGHEREFINFGGGEWGVRLSPFGSATRFPSLFEAYESLTTEDKQDERR